MIAPTPALHIPAHLATLENRNPRLQDDVLRPQLLFLLLVRSPSSLAVTYLVFPLLFCGTFSGSFRSNLVFRLHASLAMQASCPLLSPRRVDDSARRDVGIDLPVVTSCHREIASRRGEALTVIFRGLPGLDLAVLSAVTLSSLKSFRQSARGRSCGLVRSLVNASQVRFLLSTTPHPK
ncbi:hypothetical protein BJY59DRAFT_353613 [Rhodotorula toruloides]